MIYFIMVLFLVTSHGGILLVKQCNYNKEYLIFTPIKKSLYIKEFLIQIILIVS
jgi:hypothetical protein